MAALGSQSIASSYEQLLHVDRDDGGNTTTLVNVKDGDNGTTFALQLASDNIKVSGSSDLDGAVTINESSADVDFRVESNGNANMLFVDGGSDAVGIGTAVPAASHADADNLVIGTALGNNGMTIMGATGGYGSVFFADATDDSAAEYDGAIQYSFGDPSMRINVGGTLRMKIENSGTTLPTQPAFCVHPASSQDNIAVDETTVVFGTERFDQGGDFDNSGSGSTDNMFVAPVTGKYQLNVSVRLLAVDSAAGYYIVRIKTSNDEYSAIMDPDFGQDAVYWSWGLSVLADMDAADTAYVTVIQTGGTQQTDIDTDSFFSGYLAC